MTSLSQATLDAARHAGDPEADQLVAALGRDIWAVNAQLRYIHRNDQPLSLPAAASAFLARVTLPDDVEHARIANAQRFATRHLLPITTALFCASLPSAYAAANGARVLVATGRMRGDELDRRVNETARFILDVLAEGGFGPSGSGLRAIQKVRLMHAAVRVHLVETGAIVDETPINQEDLLGTLGTFSVVVLRALRRLGIEVAPTEAEDFFYLWRTVGALLGVQRALLPRGLAEAEDLFIAVDERQSAASDHGRELMRALLAGMQRHVPFAPWAPAMLVRHMVGPRLADLLAVPDATNALPRVASLLPRPPRLVARHLAPLLGRPLLNTIVQMKLGGRAADFQMPVAHIGPR